MRPFVHTWFIVLVPFCVAQKSLAEADDSPASKAMGELFPHCTLPLVPKDWTRCKSTDECTVIFLADSQRLVFQADFERMAINKKFMKQLFKRKPHEGEC